ncbi:hypothetical protein BHE74_00003646 [Ensete ventricosum]|nr:hypothetical protein BHE74_00003646 [Ensete ventricosum]
MLHLRAIARLRNPLRSLPRIFLTPFSSNSPPSPLLLRPPPPISPPSAPFSTTSSSRRRRGGGDAEADESSGASVSLFDRDPTRPPKLFVIQPRLRPDSLLHSKLAEALNLANSLEELRDGFFAEDYGSKEPPPHLVVQNPGARSLRCRRTPSSLSSRTKERGDRLRRRGREENRRRRRKIDEVRRTRALQRSARRRHGSSYGQGLATVAVVGYTNAVRNCEDEEYPEDDMTCDPSSGKPADEDDDAMASEFSREESPDNADDVASEFSCGGHMDDNDDGDIASDVSTEEVLENFDNKDADSVVKFVTKDSGEHHESKNINCVKASAMTGVGLQELLNLIDHKLNKEESDEKRTFGPWDRKWRPSDTADDEKAAEQ